MKPDICSSRHKFNANSFLANLRVDGYKPNLRERIYLSLRDQGPATCEQLSARLGIRYTTCSARISELKAETWITQSGETRKTSGGSGASVLRHLTREKRELLLHPKRPRYTEKQGSLFA